MQLNAGEEVSVTNGNVETHHQNTADAMNNLGLENATMNENGQLVGQDGKPLNIEKGQKLTQAQLMQMIQGGKGK